MIPDCRNPRGMTDRSDNSTFLLPRVHSTEQVDSTIVDLDPQSLSLAIGAALQGVLNLFPKFFCVDLFRRYGDLVGHPDDTLKPQYREFGVFALLPEVHISLKSHPAARYG